MDHVNDMSNQPNTRPRFGLVRCREPKSTEHAYYDIVDHGDGTYADEVVAHRVLWVSASVVVDALNERENTRRFLAGA